MALIKCPECNHDVSDKAVFCPNCGCTIAHNICHPREDSYTFYKPSKLPWVFAVLGMLEGIISVIFILSAASSSKTILFISFLLSAALLVFSSFVMYALFDRINTIGLMLNTKTDKIKFSEALSDKNRLEKAETDFKFTK